MSDELMRKLSSSSKGASMKYVKIMLLAALTAMITVQTRAEDITLRIACYGGQFTQTQVRWAAYLFTSRTKIKIDWIDGNPADHFAKMMATRGRNVPFDLVYLDDGVQDKAVKAGLVDKLDPSIVTNLAYIYDEAKNKSGHGPGLAFWSTGIAFNSKKFAEAGIPEPTSWNDLWDPRLEGHVALPDITQTPALDLITATAHLLGGNENDTDAAFAKLSQLKPLYYYSSSSDLRNRFLSGDVWLAVWNNGRAWGMIDEGFPMKYIYPKEGGYGHLATIDMVKGTSHPKEAQMFINQVLDPISELGQANEIPEGPTNRLVEPILAAYPDLSKRFPTAADINKLNIPDVGAINDNFDKWVDAWNRMPGK